VEGEGEVTARRAKFTQADLSRLIRAARKEGASVARVTMPDGTEFKIDLSPQSTEREKQVEPKREVVL
jgi:hypothetical protein